LFEKVVAMKSLSLQEKVSRAIRKHGGTIRMSEAMSAGISRYALYSMLNKGVIDQLSRGIYRISGQPPIANPDLVTVALRSKNAVICLISALSFHGITTRIPHEVSIAIAEGSIAPRINNPPITVYRFSPQAFKIGVETYTIDNAPVKVYCAEKTLADCFKFRNRIGMDVVLEALKLYRDNKPVKVDALIKYARICRVENIMKPYLEATL
jgi:predicted transcriptional regulator of viral defense system